MKCSKCQAKLVNPKKRTFPRLASLHYFCSNCNTSFLYKNGELREIKLKVPNDKQSP